MRKIFIDDRIKTQASLYVGQLPSIVGDVKTKLKKLAKELKKNSTKIFVYSLGHQKITDHKGGEYLRVSKYVENIADKYDNLNDMLPSKYNECWDEIKSVLKGVSVDNIWVRLKNGKGKQPLYKMVVDVMGYDKIRAELMPDYIRKLEINSCVYCNAQYTVTTSMENAHVNNKKRKIGRPPKVRTIPTVGGYYELDHNWPKSKYPFLCTNFYNLYPCCSSCNKRKSNREMPFSLYSEKKEENLRPLHFAISPQDVIVYHTKGRCIGVKPYLCDAEKPRQPVVKKKDGTLAERFNHVFDIDMIYAEHGDEVEELLWRNKIYTKGIVNATIKQFANLNIKGFDFKRYVLGTYAKKEEGLKRPLTVMKQDVWEQVTQFELEETDGREE